MNEFKQVFLICFICVIFLIVSEMDYNDKMTNPELYKEVAEHIAHEDTTELFCKMLNRGIVKYDMFGECK